MSAGWKFKLWVLEEAEGGLASGGNQSKDKKLRINIPQEKEG